MPGRDVEIDLIGHDRTGHATRSAANNLDQLAAKVRKFEASSGDATGAALKQDAALVKLGSSIKGLGADAEKSFNRLVRAENRLADAAGSLRVAEIRLNEVRASSRTKASQLAAAEERLASSTRRLTAARQELASAVDDFEVRVNVRENRSVTGRVRALGTVAGNLFTRAMSSAIQDGSRSIGNALRTVLLKLPALQAFAGIFAARLLGFIGQAITAGFGLLLGPALLAAPIAFLLKQQIDANKQVEKSEKRIAALKKRLEAAKSADVQARLRKEIAAEQRILAENEKQAAQWERLKARAKSFMDTISAPLKIPLRDALDEIGKGLGRLKGPVRDIMAAIGPALAPFTKGVMDGLLAFVKALQPALPGIVAGMQAWGQEAPKIGKALGDMIADIMKDPDKVVNSVKSISGAIQDFATSAGNIISVLTSIGDAFFKFESNINAIETGNLGNVTGVFREITRTLQEEYIVWLTYLDKMSNLPILKHLFPPGWSASVKTELAKAKAEMEAAKQKWIATDAEIKRRKIIAKIKADKAELEKKVAAAKESLNTVKNKKTEAKIRANIAHLNLQVAISNAKLTLLAKKKTVPKLEATKKDLEAKVAAAKRGLDSVKNKKTRAKIEADIRAAQARIAEIKRQIASVRGKSVVIAVSWRVGRRPSGIIGGSSTLGGTTINDATHSWAGALNGSGTSRTEPPRVIVEPPNVNTRVFLDSREIAAVVRSTVLDENRKAAHRARVGRRN